MQYFIDFESQHPKYAGWVEECDWIKELNNDIPDFPTFKQWRKLKAIALKGIDCVKKYVECVDDIVQEVEKSDVFGHDQIDSSHDIIHEEVKSSSEEEVCTTVVKGQDHSVDKEIINISSDDNEENNKSPEYKHDDVILETHAELETEVPVEEDQFQLFLSDDEENTILGYDVGEFTNHPMIAAIVSDVERSYMYEYNSFPPEGMMYYLVKERIMLQNKEPEENLFENATML